MLSTGVICSVSMYVCVFVHMCMCVLDKLIEKQNVYQDFPIFVVVAYDFDKCFEIMGNGKSV